MDTWPLPSKPNVDDGPQTELTRDIQDLDDDQLWEVLEALQTETARREGTAPPCRLLQANLRVPGSGGEADMDNREVGLSEGWDGDMVSPCSGQQVPLRPMQMSAVSAAFSWLGGGWTST